MSQPEARRDSLDDRSSTTALGWGPDDESERLTAAFDQLPPALDGADQGSRSRAQMLVRELVSQALGRSPSSAAPPLELNVIAHSGAVRVEASGPAMRFITGGDDGSSVDGRDALASWGAFMVEGLVDRWGTEGAEFAWFEIDKGPA